MTGMLKALERFLNYGGATLKIGFRQPFLIAICILTLFGASSAIAKDASEIFKIICTPCHGMNGEGKKPMGPPLMGSEFIKTSSDADVKKTIQNGRGGIEKTFKDFPAPMPPQKALNDAELDALVKYLKDLNSIPPLNAEESLSPSSPVTPEQRPEEKVQEEKTFDFKDLISKKMTFAPLLKDKAQAYYYESLSDFKIKKMPLNAQFSISEIIPQDYSQYYRIKFKGGKEGYINIHQVIHNWIGEYSCSNCENISQPERSMTSLARTICDNIAIKRGFPRGKSLWLKYAKFDLPWLKKIKVKDYKLDDDGIVPITMLIDVDGEEKEVSFYAPEFDDLFYVSDPAPRIAKWGKRVLTAIKDNKVFIGMTKEQVMASWGVPDDINRTVGPWGVHEQWIYGDNGNYLYFQNDKLTSWQD